MATRPAVFGVERSLSGKAWRWRGGNMEIEGGVAGPDALLSDDIVTQLLLARGVPRGDLARHRSPSLRGFLPDPSLFADMDGAADRIAEAVLARETVTVYGDYDVDGATSAALLIRLFRMLGHEARHYIPDRLLEGYGPSGEALVRLGQEARVSSSPSTAGQWRTKRSAWRTPPGSTSSWSITTSARPSCRSRSRW